MPWYIPPPSPYGRAVGDIPPETGGGSRLENALPSDFELEQLGIHSETQSVIAFNHGELDSLGMGSFEQFSFSLPTPTGTVQAFIVQLQISENEADTETVERAPPDLSVYFQDWQNAVDAVAAANQPPPPETEPDPAPEPEPEPPVE